ncbi:efflux RND transporter periplasmic adaptor subunit [Alcaligenaceae bacterium]|nr:efflux RND transporter periplasmic adaptor subunit [Alcaligenaceae bacterium]
MSNLRLLSGQSVRLVMLSSLLVLAACGKQEPQAGGAMKVPVSVITVQPQSTEVFVALPGRVEAIQDAQIRARVSGIVNEINFQQGSEVTEGQLLFTIDPAPYQAVRDQAAAQLKRTQADLQAVRALSQRYAKLIKENAISRQEYDNAVAQAGQAEAAVAAAQAALKSADIDLGYTKVVSPINGRIGKSLVTVGALVSAANATQLATVQQLDKVYVDLTRSTTELAQLRRAHASGELTLTPEGAAVAQVLLEDGTVYQPDGKLLFSGVSVDPTTGQVNLRAEFANPDQILLPGMYVRVQLQQGTDTKALLVPQQAIQRTTDGLNTLMLVKDEKVAPMAVTTGVQVGGSTIITKGLNPGDIVIVAGFQKIRPGAPVQAMPWKAEVPAPAGQAPATASPTADSADSAAADSAKK